MLKYTVGNKQQLRFGMFRSEWLNKIWKTNDKKRAFFTWSQMSPKVEPDTIKVIRSDSVGEAYDKYLKGKDNG